jgi:RNA polymerase sigma factor (TIGR02999 family)
MEGSKGIESEQRPGDGMSGEELLPVVYDELRRLAASRLAREAAGATLQPTALVHEAWLRVSGHQDRNWVDRSHFFRTAALAMRRILVDRARQKASLKGGGEGGREIFAFSPDFNDATPDDRLLLIDECLQRLEKEDPDSARIVLLKFFAGLTNQEAANTLGVNVRTIERQWAYAKAALFQMVRELQSHETGNG